MNTIIREFFDANFTYNRKMLAPEPRQVYSFVLNNADHAKRWRQSLHRWSLILLT